MFEYVSEEFFVENFFFVCFFFALVMEAPAAAAARYRADDDAPTKARKTRIFKTFSRQAQDLFGCHFKQIDAFYREVT